MIVFSLHLTVISRDCWLLPNLHVDMFEYWRATVLVMIPVYSKVAACVGGGVVDSIQVGVCTVFVPPASLVIVVFSTMCTPCIIIPPPCGEHHVVVRCQRIAGRLSVTRHREPVVSGGIPHREVTVASIA